MRPIVRPAAKADPKALLEKKERKEGRGIGLGWCKDFMRFFLKKINIAY